MRDAGKAIFYLSYLKNSKASGVEPRTPLGKFKTLPQSCGEGAPPPRFLGGAKGAYIIYLSGPPPPLSKIPDPPLILCVYVLKYVSLNICISVCI